MDNIVRQTNGAQIERTSRTTVAKVDLPASQPNVFYAITLYRACCDGELNRQHQRRD